MTELTGSRGLPAGRPARRDCWPAIAVSTSIEETMDQRYNSGTSLQRTEKEEDLDSLEHLIGDMSDNLYMGLKKLTLLNISELQNLIKERLREVGGK